MSSQQINEMMHEMINNYIKHTRNDLWFQHYPKDYAQALSGKTDYAWAKIIIQFNDYIFENNMTKQKIMIE